MPQLIDLLTTGATFLLAFIVFINLNKLNVKANFWFGFFILFVFFILFQNILSYTKVVDEDSLISDVLSISNLVVAQLYYFSISFYINPLKKWKIQYIFHFSLAIIFLFLTLLSQFFVEKEPIKDLKPENFETIYLIFNLILFFQITPYLVFSFIKIRKHQKQIKLLNSTLESVDLEWLRKIVIGVSIISIFWIVDIIFGLSENYVIFNMISSLIYLVTIFYIAYSWLKQKEIFPYPNNIKKEIKDLFENSNLEMKNRKKLMKDEELKEAKIKLLNVIEDEKPFLNCDLNLVSLATLLNLSTHVLSYIINEGFNENFYQFINRYRIEEAKKMLLDKNMQHFSILGIGFEVGFNSKTVFNTTFKKITGMTPSEYQKNFKK